VLETRDGACPAEPQRHPDHGVTRGPGHAQEEQVSNLPFSIIVIEVNKYLSFGARKSSFICTIPCSFHIAQFSFSFLLSEAQPLNAIVNPSPQKRN
jgi:hypothetical protein